MLFNEENIKTQTVLLTLQGKIVSSCNTLFDSAHIAPFPAEQGLPLLHSILQTFQEQISSKIHLPRIETVLAELPGFYDFTFETVLIKKRPFIRWMIYDFTTNYQALQRKQQQHHERKIRDK